MKSKDVGIFVPDDFFVPNLRHSAFSQLRKTGMDTSSTALQLIRKSDIPYWICQKANQRVDAYLRKIPTSESVQPIIANEILSINKDQVRSYANEVDLYYEDTRLGSSQDPDYYFRMPNKVNAIQKDLARKTVEKLSNDVGDRIVSNISEKFSDKHLHRLFNLAPAIQSNVLLSVIVSAFAFFLLPIEAVVMVVPLVMSIISPVNVNARSWRNTIADEVYAGIDSKLFVKHVIMSWQKLKKMLPMT